MSQPTAPPSPLLLFDALNGYQRTAAIRAAIELDLFSAVAEGRTSAAAISQRCEASERGIRILADSLVIMGFLTKQDGAYGLTGDSALFLDRRSPAYLGGVVEFLLSDPLLDAFRNLTTAVRQGGTAMSEEGTMETEHPVWVRFARAMMPMMAGPAAQIAALAPLPEDRPARILDVAAGHGLFGLAFLERYPHAEVVAQDWAPVLEVARENAERAGAAERFSILAGSAFDVEYGSGYDLVLLTNFLHHFDPETCVGLLRKVHAALDEGGRAVTLEFIPNDDRVTPPPAALFALTMLGTTARGDAYTFAELEAMFREAGFRRSELLPLENSAEQVVVSYR